jgi:hypothetical protein
MAIYHCFAHSYILPFEIRNRSTLRKPYRTVPYVVYLNLPSFTHHGAAGPSSISLSSESTVPLQTTPLMQCSSSPSYGESSLSIS